MVVNLYKVKKYTYERLYNSTLLKYEPIENYDRIESITDSTIKDTTGSTDYGLQNTTSSITSSSADGAQKMIIQLRKNGVRRDNNCHKG